MDIHDSKIRIFKDIGQYSVAHYSAALFTFCGHLIFRRLLPPDEYGLWEVFLVIIGYATAANFGILRGMAREVPFYLGKKDLKKTKTIQNSSVAVLFLIISFLGIVLFIASFFLEERYSEKVIWGLRAVSVIIVLTQIYNIFFTLIKSYKDFTLLSRMRIFLPLATTVLCGILIFRHGIYGMFAGHILALLILAIYISAKTNFNFKFQIDIKEVKAVFKVGILIFVWSYLSGIFLTLDRVMIAKYLGTASLGYYSIATMIHAAMANLPKPIAANMYPRIIQAYGYREAMEDVYKYVIQSAKSIAWFFPLILGIVYYLIELPVRFILPEYIRGISACKILILGTFFIFLRHTFEHLLIAKKKMIQLSLLQLPPALLMVVISIIMIKSNAGIDGIAFAMSAAFFVYATILISYSYRFFEKGWTKTFKLIAELYLPYCFILGLIFLINRTDGFLGIPADDHILLATVRSLLLSVLAIPVYYYINRQTGALSNIIDIARQFILERKRNKRREEEAVDIN